MTRPGIMVLCCIALASCGSDGGGNGVAVTPAPTPTPIINPTPTPTAAAYQTYAQLSGDQSFKTACAALRFDYSPPLPVTAVSFGSGLTVAYTAATQTYLLSPDPRDTGLFGSQPRGYGPADRDASVTTTTATSYARTTNGFQERFTIGANSAGGAAPDYVRGIFLRVPLFASTVPGTAAAQYQCVFGVPTRLDDLPTATLTYTRGGLNGVATNYPSSGAPETYAVTQSQVSVSVNFAANSLTMTVHVIGALQTATGTATTTTDLGTYTGTATINRTSGFYSGQITSTDRAIQTASFAGWFFGPQSSEAAFSLSFDSLDQTSGKRIIFLGNALALK